MGSAFWAQPAKRLDREFRDMGARRVERTPTRVCYRFPDGARIEVPRNIGAGGARAMLSGLQRKYQRIPDEPLGDACPAPGAPHIDMERLSASDHAKQRLTLMQSQDDLTFREVLEALRIPERVLWSERHGSWLWVRDRIAVAVWVSGDGHGTIGTILWAKTELVLRNPRPA